jgi:hypothetical protein
MQHPLIVPSGLTGEEEGEGLDVNNNQHQKSGNSFFSKVAVMTV